MFVPGQLVVCVDDTFKKPDDINGLRKGVVYTVRDWLPAYFDHHPRAPEDCARLAEIRRPPCEKCGLEDSPFAARRFRPLDDSRLDVFRKALTGAPKDEELVE